MCGIVGYVRSRPAVDIVMEGLGRLEYRGCDSAGIALITDAVAQYTDHLILVPQTPVLMAPLVTAVPLQVLACEFAAARGLEVDQPRNLAKSVTVE